MFRVPCCDVRCGFPIVTMFGLSLSPVVCGMSYLRCLCLFVYNGVQHILWCVFVLFFFVLCALCCRFLCIVLFDCPSVFSNVYNLRSSFLFLIHYYRFPFIQLLIVCSVLDFVFYFPDQNIGLISSYQNVVRSSRTKMHNILVWSCSRAI